MKKELFPVYKEVLLKSISSCVSTEQLTCCYDMMERFREQFTGVIEPREIAIALDELSSEYLQKQNEVTEECVNNLINQ